VSEVRALCRFELVFTFLESCTALVCRLLVTFRDNLSETSLAVGGSLKSRLSCVNSKKRNDGSLF
jgi:hypothetical protein